MPTYEYECDACEHRFELFQQMGSAPKKTCPECKKRRLRRLIGAGGGIIFKGSGFYETDYRSESYKKSAKADKEAQAPKESSSKDSKKDSSSSSSKKASSSKD